MTRLLILNAIAWPAMLVASLAASLMPALRWIVVTLAAVLLINGLLHLGATIATASYSPGLISGVLVYLPVAAICLRRAARELPASRVVAATALGFLIHATVVLAAFFVGTSR